MIPNMNEWQVKILVYLSRYKIPEDREIMPYSTTAIGIGESLHRQSPNNIYRNLSILVKAGLVNARKSKVKDSPNPNFKVNFLCYTITDQGRILAGAFKQVWPEVVIGQEALA